MTKIDRVITKSKDIDRLPIFKNAQSNFILKDENKNLFQDTANKLVSNKSDLISKQFYYIRLLLAAIFFYISLPLNAISSNIPFINQVSAGNIIDRKKNTSPKLWKLNQLLNNSGWFRLASHSSHSSHSSHYSHYSSSTPSSQESNPPVIPTPAPDTTPNETPTPEYKSNQLDESGQGSNTRQDFHNAQQSTQQVLTITGPNGGEKVINNSYLVITWSSKGIEGDVKLELSTDGGGTWETIADKTTNDGAYLWTVKSADTSTALIRISSIKDPRIFDTTDTTFTIYTKNEK